LYFQRHFTAHVQKFPYFCRDIKLSIMKKQAKPVRPTKYLISLPINIAGQFHSITGLGEKEWFCSSDPSDCRLGSGGGTAWLIENERRACAPRTDFENWITQESRIIIHAGGQGRRIPAYAPSGKILTPIPVLRWTRGQKIDQTLLDFQKPLFDQIMQQAPTFLRTLIASGDVMIRTGKIGTIPEADVVCFGLWEEPSLASHHGVFMMDRKQPEKLDFMLQKPSVQELAALTESHFFLIDVGLWLLSDNAIRKLTKKSQDENGNFQFYDLYSDFGRALGQHPTCPDDDLTDLSVAIVPLEDGEFYHFGTSRELLSSTSTLMNIVKDQRLILQSGFKQHPSIFTQNAIVPSSEQLKTPNIWIENACISDTWNIASQNIITGVPENNWNISLQNGQCVDVVPIGDADFVLRPYGFNDAFKGALENETTAFLERPFKEWAEKHHVALSDFKHISDLQSAELFPVCHSTDIMERLLSWFLANEGDEDTANIWRNCQRLSADNLLDKANLKRLFLQRKKLQNINLKKIASNFRKSIFYQTDLSHTASLYKEGHITLPTELENDINIMTRMQDAMFRAEYERNLGNDGMAYDNKAFGLLRQALIEGVSHKKRIPQLNVCSDQIVWGRSAVRIDVAGGWTDTPPYSLSNGGNVVNLAIELNGQQPLQVYVKPNKDFNVVCRSIDLGAMEIIDSYEELSNFNKVGSPFSIPKAALALAGFHPDFCPQKFHSLRSQLESFGSGIDITLLAAIPAGSGLGTSSILASTVLGALGDFCGLEWTKNDICNYTLVLEQMLTTGGGWQDQFGGVLHGVKLLQTTSGLTQDPIVNWLPENIFRQEDHKACHLLYYTGITRTAKNILTDIVRNMFLNNNETLLLLNEMKQHALNMHSAILHGNFNAYGQLVRKTWLQNKQLDMGTCPPMIEKLCDIIDDYCLGYKLPGAGGGGYMYIVAKDPEAAAKIRRLLTINPLTPRARFVTMNLSNTGMQISRS